MKIDCSQAYSFLAQGETQAKPLVGISACLCGDRVRYDGQDKGQPKLIQALEKQLQLLKICPEVAIGMGVPRPPIQLVRSGQKTEALGVENPQQNVTSELAGYAQAIINHHAAITTSHPPLCGFILKNRSPSCGVGNTPIHENGLPVAMGSGIFAQQLQQQLPWLPITGEEALSDTQQRQRFIHHCQLVQFFWQTSQRRGLAAFHQSASHLFELLASSEKSALEKLINTANPQPQQYLTQLIKALAAKSG